MQTPSSGQGLARVLGPFMAMAVVVGIVIGSGVFKKGKNVAENVPEFGLAMSAWVLGGLLALLGALTVAELAVLYPRAGGSYVYLREAYGRWAGFLWGWVDFWIVRAASIAALATMFTESLHDILRQSLPPGSGGEVLSFWPRQALSVGVISLLAFVNVRGTRLGGGLLAVVTIVKVASLLLIIALPFAAGWFVSGHAHEPVAGRLGPIFPADWSTFDWGRYGAALVAVLWAYHGWISFTPVAEEVRDPQRNLPLALVAGVLIIIGLYCGANLAYYLVVPQPEMAALARTPVATEFCLRLLGPIGAAAASAMFMISVFGALNGNLLTGPRLLFAMGRDGLAPSALKNLHPRFGTPATATAVLTAWSCLLILGVAVLMRIRLPIPHLFGGVLDLNLPKEKSLFDTMTDFVIFGAVTFETLAVASIFVFRWKVPLSTRPASYRCPGYPVVPALYVLIMCAVLINMFATPHQRVEAVVGMGFIGLGAIVYWRVLARK